MRLELLKQPNNMCTLATATVNRPPIIDAGGFKCRDCFCVCVCVCTCESIVIKQSHTENPSNIRYTSSFSVHDKRHTLPSAKLSCLPNRSGQNLRRSYAPHVQSLNPRTPNPLIDRHTHIHAHTRTRMRAAPSDDEDVDRRETSDRPSPTFLSSRESGLGSRRAGAHCM